MKKNANKVKVVVKKKTKKSQKILLALLAIVLISLLLSIIYCITEINYLQTRNSNLHDTIEKQSKQIESRNKVIDKHLGTNLSDPLSQVVNKEYYNTIKSQKKGFNIITDTECNNIKLPLYTPDGKNFGVISYSAYQAILYDDIDNYECLNNEERDILFSYLQYLRLDEGLSISK